MSLISRRTLASSSRVLQTAASTASQNASASASGSGPGSKERETANSIIQNVLAMYSQSASTGAASNPFGGAATSGAPGGMDEGRIMLSNLPSGPSGPRPLFAAGETLPPHTLSATALNPPSRPPARPPLLGPSRSLAKQLDPFVQSGTRPLDHALNPEFAYQFVDRMGRIKGRNMTGLSWKSQRAVGKMVRRARAMGVISGWSDRGSVGGYGAQ